MSMFESYVRKKEQLSTLSDEYYMSLALEAAQRAKSKNDAPVGAVLSWPKRHLVEHDTVQSDCSPLNTASVNVIRKALDMMPHRVANGTLYCTVEPDALSVLAAVQSGINEVVFGVYDHRHGFLSSNRSLDVERFDISSKGGVMAKECFEPLSDDVKEYCSIERRKQR